MTDSSAEFEKYQCFKQQPHDPHHWGSMGADWQLCPGIPNLLDALEAAETERDEAKKRLVSHSQIEHNSPHPMTEYHRAYCDCHSCQQLEIIGLRTRMETGNNDTCEGWRTKARDAMAELDEARAEVGT